MHTDEIIAGIQALSPEQRRQLQLRLRAIGLLEPMTLVTDQDRLAVAPALSVGTRRRSATATVAALPTTALDAAPTPVQAPSAATADYRTPVSGKAVINETESTAGPGEANAMQPLPGQAPEQPIAVVFDGGSRGNPGEGYGSYNLRWPGAQPQTVRLRFGDRVTNNEAEYDTLIAALDAVLKRLADNKADPKTARVDLRGDSLLVVNQIRGEWECKEERLRVRRDYARTLLQRFGHWQLRHHDREQSVRILGH